jgi:prepilin-type N-terminal cleavage/methylation domain-containing protein
VTRPTRSAGFTTTELMVVVAILGVMAALSLRALKTDPVGQDARKVAALLVTARRTALQGGPVRADVVADIGSRARSQITFEDDGGRTVARVWLLREFAVGASPLYEWVEITGLALSEKTALRGVSDTADIDPGATLPDVPTATVTKNFFPDGTSEAMVVYLGDADKSKWRVVMFPASSVPTVYSDW